MATFPAVSPTHRGLSRGALLGYIADYAQRRKNAGTAAAAFPAVPPTHRGLSRGDLLGYIADNTQPR